MTPKEAAKALKVSKATVYRMIEDGRVIADTLDYRKRGRLLIRRESVERYLPSVAKAASAS